MTRLLRILARVVAIAFRRGYRDGLHKGQSAAKEPLSAYLPGGGETLKRSRH